jgi:hypothetical protein
MRFSSGVLVVHRFLLFIRGASKPVHEALDVAINVYDNSGFF